MPLRYMGGLFGSAGVLAPGREGHPSIYIWVPPSLLPCCPWGMQVRALWLCVLYRARKLEHPRKRKTATYEAWPESIRAP